jgi:glucose/arabinose dehydrogenase
MKAIAILLLSTLSLASCSEMSISSPVKVERDVPNAQGFRRVTVVQGLEHPWSVAWLPDETMLVTERPGRLRIVRNGRLDPKPITGVPKVFAVGQGGLMDGWCSRSGVRLSN